MLDFKTQLQLVDATATVMRAYLRAATNTYAASAGRSLSLWSELLEAAGAVGSWNGAAQPKPSRTQSSDAARAKPDADFASYRSAGGHAAAQVIVPAVTMASVTATAALSPVQAMLGVWRAALGA